MNNRLKETEKEWENFLKHNHGRTLRELSPIFIKECKDREATLKLDYPKQNKSYNTNFNFI